MTPAISATGKATPPAKYWSCRYRATLGKGRRSPFGGLKRSGRRCAHVDSVNQAPDAFGGEEARRSHIRLRPASIRRGPQRLSVCCTHPADSDEAAPLFRDDCAPGFRDDLAPCFRGSAGSNCCQFVRVMCQALRGRFRRRLSPLSSMRWALWTRRSRMASA